MHSNNISQIEQFTYKTQINKQFKSSLVIRRYVLFQSKQFFAHPDENFTDTYTLNTGIIYGIRKMENIVLNNKKKLFLCLRVSVCMYIFL